MTGQKFKEITQDLLLEYTKSIVGRELRPLEYNMFFHHNADALERMYFQVKQQMQSLVVNYLAELKEKDENTNV